MIKQIQQNVKIHEYGERVYISVLCSTLILATILYVLNYFCIKVNNHTHTHTHTGKSHEGKTQGGKEEQSSHP